MKLILRKGSATDPTQAGGVMGIKKKKALMKTVNAFIFSLVFGMPALLILMKLDKL